MLLNSPFHSSVVDLGEDLAKFHHFLLQVIDDKYLNTIGGLNPEALTEATREHSGFSVNYLKSFHGAQRTFPRLFSGCRIEAIWLKKYAPIGYHQMTPGRDPSI